jgi:hypothetical protein
VHLRFKERRFNRRIDYPLIPNDSHQIILSRIYYQLQARIKSDGTLHRRMKVNIHLFLGSPGRLSKRHSQNYVDSEPKTSLLGAVEKYPLGAIATRELRRVEFSSSIFYIGTITLLIIPSIIPSKDGIVAKNFRKSHIADKQFPGIAHIWNWHISRSIFLSRL